MYKVAKISGTHGFVFNDLKISELKEHIGSYGEFGIGLKKKWTIDNKLNPVMYVSQNSNVIDGVLKDQELLFKMVTEKSDIDDLYSNYRNHIMRLSTLYVISKTMEAIWRNYTKLRLC